MISETMKNNINRFENEIEEFFLAFPFSRVFKKVFPLKENFLHNSKTKTNTSVEVVKTLITTFDEKLRSGHNF